MEEELGVSSPATPFASPGSCMSFDYAFGSPLEISRPVGEDEALESQEELLLAALRRLSDRYDDCFLCLHAAAADLAGLRRENLRLSAEKLHLSVLLDEREASASAFSSAAASWQAPEKQGLEPAPTPPGWSATAGGARGGMPKSISIRSKGFLSSPQPPVARIGDGGGPAAPPQRLLVRASPSMEGDGKGDGEEEGEEDVEVEVYRQGMEKTELCNKWEEGACPYAHRCRFAHGVQELRPVIRHPRYKTLPCRMFAGSRCPYGHRCHFRHSPLPTAATKQPLLLHTMPSTAATDQ